MGSGTTAVSCVDNKRQYLGIELHQEYVDMSKNRIAKFEPLNNFFE
jgi:site-specific DNA-methyltransferase (adenine-specific)